MPYDPFDDENKQYTLEEFIAVAKEELEAYLKVWAKEPRNEFHGQAHTWNEWWKTFFQYMSW